MIVKILGKLEVPENKDLRQAYGESEENDAAIKKRKRAIDTKAWYRNSITVFDASPNTQDTLVL